MYGRAGKQQLFTAACLAFLVAACGGGGSDAPTGPRQNQSSPNAPGVRAVLGAGVTDTIDAQPLQALVVEVRGPGGQLATGAVVRFEAQPPADTTRRKDAAIFVCPLSAQTCGLAGFALQFVVDTTDAQGHARAVVRLGRVAGRAVVRLTVPELALEDSATFTVLPGAAAGVHALTADTALTIGSTAKLGATVVDRYGNYRPEPAVVTVGTGNSLTFDAATGVVTARDIGTQSVIMHALSSAVDSTTVRVVPAGRLVVWSSNESAVRLVNLDGSATKTVLTAVASDLGAFPRFDATRKVITVHDGSTRTGGVPNSVIVVDTSGSPQRDLGPAVGFATVIATRQLADGTLLVVGSTVAGAPCAGFALFRVAADNSLTCVVALPGLGAQYGAADISHDGTRVAYVGTDASNPSAPPFELRVLDVATGATTVLESIASAPRWSSRDDQVAYLVPNPRAYNGIDGAAVIINADGTGRRALGTFVLSPGLAWSPDGTYIVGRDHASGDVAMRVIRISDGATVLLRFRTTAGATADYYQPDWR
ncbi:MAG TPA: hypothetical protein VN602_07785 [Gemmatimonadaceae bacterium]|nr:hypothetical protein [Gemmatimonadaceae bacterium]